MTAPEPEAATTGTRGPTREEIRDRLAAAILGGVPSLTGDDVARESGFTREETQRYWRALGFADAGETAAFGEPDVEALHLLGSTLASGALDEETAVRLTRAVGQTLARLAEWEVATLTARVEQLERGDQATGSRMGSAIRLADEVGPIFDRLLVYSWRRHLAAAVARVEALGARDADLHTVELTVGFADIVGFTAYSNEHTQDEIGELVETFESRCFDAVARGGARVIKTLGDSVLFVSTRPDEAYDVAADIVSLIGGDPALPDVRVGLATGPVQLQLGDVFGPAVNLSARMTAVARRNRVIVDQRTAELLPAAEFLIRPLPARPVRGFGDLEPVAVRRR